MNGLHSQYTYAKASTHNTTMPCGIKHEAEKIVPSMPQIFDAPHTMCRPT